MSWEKFPKFLGKMTKRICKGWRIIKKIGLWYRLKENRNVKIIYKEKGCKYVYTTKF